MSQPSNGQAQQNPQAPKIASKALTDNLAKQYASDAHPSLSASRATTTDTAAESPSAVQQPTTPAASHTPTPSAPPVEKVWIVRFHAKSHPNDTDDVALPVNGEIHQVKRETEGPCPERFLECADHATYPHYKQEQGKQRKVAAFIRRFPHTKICESTWEEYRRWKADGTRINQEHLDKYGMERPNEG